MISEKRIIERIGPCDQSFSVQKQVFPPFTSGETISFGGVPALVVCDNCKQAVLANQDWIEPVLNKDYAEWAEHNHTVIMPAKVRKPKMKSSVENAVGILESSIFHTLAARQYFSLEQFNQDLWTELEKLNHAPFKKKPHDRYYYWMVNNNLKRGKVFAIIDSPIIIKTINLKAEWRDIEKDLLNFVERIIISLTLKNCIFRRESHRCTEF